MKHIEVYRYTLKNQIQNNNMNKITLVKQFVKNHLSKEYSGHDYFHALRVWKMAKKIAKNYDVDLEVVEISALLHDLIDEKLDNHLTNKDIVDFLKSIKLELIKIKKVLNIINSISFRKQIPKSDLSMEAKIVQDADRLDALGAVGIARVFAYAGRNRKLIYSSNNNETAIHHFYEKLFLLKDKMNTPEAKEIAKKRDKFMHEFLNEFLKEWNI